MLQMCIRDSIDILQAHVRCPERLVTHAVAGFDVRTAGDFRDDAAIERMSKPATA